MSLPPRHLGVAALVTGGFALLPLSTDFYLASLPGLARDFGSGAGEVQLTLSVFVIGFALSQLVWGPLSDRFGRRPALLAGCAVYLASAVVCASAPSLPVLVAARFFQAIGACAGAVVGRAVIRDAYGVEGTARVMGFASSASSVFPLLGPPLGGLLEVHYGWRASFVVLTAYSAGLLAAMALFLGETNVHRRGGAPDWRGFARDLRALVLDPGFAGYALLFACGYGGIFAFISGSSFALIQVVGVSPPVMGVLFGTAVAGYIVGTLATGFLARRLGSDRMLAAGTLLAAAAGLAMAALAAARVHTAWAVVAPMAVYMLATGINLPNAVGGAIGPHATRAGTASALMGFVQMTLAAAVGTTVARLFDGTTLPMAGAIGAMGLGAWASFALLVRRRS